MVCRRSIQISNFIAFQSVFLTAETEWCVTVCLPPALTHKRLALGFFSDSLTLSDGGHWRGYSHRWTFHSLSLEERSLEDLVDHVFYFWPFTAWWRHVQYLICANVYSLLCFIIHLNVQCWGIKHVPNEFWKHLKGFVSFTIINRQDRHDLVLQNKRRSHLIHSANFIFMLVVASFSFFWGCHVSVCTGGVR